MPALAQIVPYPNPDAGPTGDHADQAYGRHPSVGISHSVRGFGGIAYYHIADTYIALCSHFLSCGTWEGLYLIDGLIRNTSAIQPDVIHADTQGQTTTVFAMAYLLGIQLMPRIRHWKDLVFYRPSKEATYRNTVKYAKVHVRHFPLS